MVKLPSVSTHSRPKAAEPVRRAKGHPAGFQHTAARRRLAQATPASNTGGRVSTHSRPKAAVPTCSPRSKMPLFQHTAARRRLLCTVQKICRLRLFQHTAARRRLLASRKPYFLIQCFNTQPPEGGWAKARLPCQRHWRVSTHSRPKAAGGNVAADPSARFVSTHSRPKAAGQGI